MGVWIVYLQATGKWFYCPGENTVNFFLWRNNLMRWGVKCSCFTFTWTFSWSCFLCCSFIMFILNILCWPGGCGVCVHVGNGKWKYLIIEAWLSPFQVYKTSLWLFQPSLRLEHKWQLWTWFTGAASCTVKCPRGTLRLVFKCCEVLTGTSKCLHTSLFYVCLNISPLQSRHVIVCRLLLSFSYTWLCGHFL